MSTGKRRACRLWLMPSAKSAQFTVPAPPQNASSTWRQKMGVSPGRRGSRAKQDLCVDLSMRSERWKQSKTSTFLDLHNWVFTPCSFRLLIEDLYQLGYIRLREICFFDTEGCEFYITLGWQGSGPTFARLELVQLNAQQA